MDSAHGFIKLDQESPRVVLMLSYVCLAKINQIAFMFSPDKARFIRTDQESAQAVQDLSDRCLEILIQEDKARMR